MRASGGRALVAVATTLAIAGCGTTTIVASDPGARIFVDGRQVGRGQAEIDQRGTPGSTTVTAQTDDGRRGTAVVSRRFTGFTLLTGLVTYGICLFACWEYPGSVFVNLPPAYAPAAPGMAPPGVDPWLMPPPGWQPKNAAPPAAAAPTGDAPAR